MMISKAPLAARTLVGLGMLCILAPALAAADEWVGPTLTPTAVQIATGAPIQIFVSSSQCAWGRPQILGLQEN